ncbi:zinc metalloproteinase nas-23-like [Tubulanus polymorphus]|uniref:zinc metalloproteinase nas-23-like n=1 Tax=Tubulanus polymorphus TaxID=672921 RepID=UPI003DA42669
MKFVIFRCATHVGKADEEGAQVVSLGADCAFKGIVIHAVTHALGFTDAQSKPNVDKYVHLTRDYITRDELSVAELVGINQLYGCSENLGSLGNMSPWTPWTPCNSDCVSTRSRFCKRDTRLRINPIHQCSPGTDQRGIETVSRNCPRDRLFGRCD